MESVDVVRGFALFGVLLVNMYNFGATFPVWTSPQDKFALAITQVFFEYKSFRLFSFLFGFGIALQLAKSLKTGNPGFAFYLRRLGFLFIIGMLNCLLYDGDVLMLYAEFGVILILLRKVPGNLLLIGWLLLNLHFPIQNAIGNFSDGPMAKPPIETTINQSRDLIRELRQTHPYSVGSAWEVMAYNANAIPPNPLENSSFLGMCLLGMYAARRRYFQEPDNHRTLIKRVFIWGVLLGFLGMAVTQFLKVSIGYSSEGSGGGAWAVILLGDICSLFGSTALALGYAAGLIQLTRSTRYHCFVAPLANAGRFALTTYLVQTIMFSTLFYGYGFDQGLRIGPFKVFVIAILFFALQIISCNWWARHFRYGPAEWVWRSISYWDRIPLRKPHAQ